MKKALAVVALGLLIAAPVSQIWAASNKDRVGLGARKSEEQPPQASETLQYCTDASARVKTAGKGQETEILKDGQQFANCSAAPASRTSEEARSESRKVERNPQN